jgi:cholesterol transport system auxiliary component
VVSDNDNVTQQGNRLTQVRVELEEFSQVFTAPDASIGLVRLRASVTRDGVLGQRVFVAQRPAATQDAAGGARALAEAAAQAAEELAQWLQTVAP